MHILTPVHPSLAMTFDICSHLTATSARNCPWQHVCWGTIRCLLCFFHVNSFVFPRLFSFVLLPHRVLLYWLYLASRSYFFRSASSYETCHTASTTTIQHRANSKQLWTYSNAHSMCFFHKKSPVFFKSWTCHSFQFPFKYCERVYFSIVLLLRKVNFLLYYSDCISRFTFDLFPLWFGTPLRETPACPSICSSVYGDSFPLRIPVQGIWGH